MELGRDTMSRITIDRQNGVAVWHPDGNHIAFTAERGGAFNLFSQSIDSSERERRLTESLNTQFPTSWSPDGRKLAFVEFNFDVSRDGSEFFMVRTDQGGEAKRLVAVTNWFSEPRDRVPVPR